MDTPFEVIGDVLGEEVSAELEGSVLGSVLGHGDDEVVGVITRGGQMRPVRMPPGNYQRFNKPSWRQHELAPGVVKSGEGMIVLPMTPQQNGGTFTSVVTAITWQGQLQKPFRSERLLVSSVRTGATAVGRLLGQVFVGVDLQQADITGFDIELIGAANSFGTRMTLIQAPPGVLIRIPVVLSSGLTAPDTIFASVQFIGRSIH